MFWIHDDSRGCARTSRFLDHTVTLIVRLILLVALMEDLRKDPEDLRE